jgi:DNA polymerase IV
MRIVAHLDLNSFFASVEQQANPFLRGRPLGVCAYLHKHGCVIAASIEAKERGMKVGMTVEEAERSVPNAVFVQNDPPKYRAVTSRVFSILHELTDTIEHYSIDEAFLDLTGWYRDAAEAAWALARVRARIRNEVGEWLRCSIGIAPTRFLAKLGSDLQKPSGLTIITKENLDEILARLDLEDVCGIGPRIRRRIEKLGYRSLLEVKRAAIPNLMREFGKNGYMLWAKLNAIEVERVASDEPPPKSIGHSYCVPNRVNREGKVEAVLAKLTERAGRRLRRQKLYAGVVSVAVGLRESESASSPHGSFWRPSTDEGGSVWTRLDEPADDSFTLVGTASVLLHDLWNGKHPVNFLAVTLTELGEPSKQMGMLAGHEAVGDVRRRLLSSAADKVKDKYGDEALVLGRLFNVGVDEAPDRIGFRKTGGVDVEHAWDGAGRHVS